MPNLLGGGRSAPPPLSPLDPLRLDRLATRAEGLTRLAWPECEAALARETAPLATDLEELEQAPAPALCDALMETIERMRRALATARAAPLAGDWLCYWPGRSLATGEADVASRGFFDVWDRPPPGLWVEAATRRLPGRPDVELAVLCWVPEVALERARAGCAASPTRSLAWLADVSDPLHAQVRRAIAASRRGH